MATSDPTTFISRLTAGDVLRYPENIGSKTDGLHHFMIIKEYRFLEQEKTDDPFNGLQKFMTDNSFNLIDTFSTGAYTNNYRQINSFVLYLPQGVFQTVYNTNYDDVELGFFGATIEKYYGIGEQKVREAYEKYKNDTKGFFSESLDMYGGIFDAVKPMATDALNSYARDSVDRIKFNAIQAGGAFLGLVTDAGNNNIAAQSMRRQENPYTSLVFTGVRSLRQHTFDFDFKPKNYRESKNVLKIIAMLKKGMLPSLTVHQPSEVSTSQIDEPSTIDVNKNDLASTTQIRNKKNTVTYTDSNRMPSQFFKFPNVYTIDFYDLDSYEDGNPFLFKIGQSVLESLTVKYGNTYFEKDGYPTNITLNLSFKENFALNRQMTERGY